MRNNFLAFWPGHCIYIRNTFFTVLTQAKSLIKTIVIRIEKGIIPQKMIKKGLKEDLTNFLQTPNKLFSKKSIQINKNKQKISIRETSLRKATISSLNSSNK